MKSNGWDTMMRRTGHGSLLKICMHGQHGAMIICANDFASEEGAKDLLEAYHRKIGGTPEPPKKGKPGKKSLGKRASSAMEESPAPTSSKKGRSRKSETNGAEWTPPLGLWEDHVTRVTAIIEGDEVDEDGTIDKSKGVQTLEGLLEWNNGRKTQHKMPVLRQKCPQRLLDYYEGHL